MNICNHFEYILSTLTVIITTNVLGRRLNTSLYWRRLQLTNKPYLNSNHHSVFITDYVKILLVFRRTSYVDNRLAVGDGFCTFTCLVRRSCTVFRGTRYEAQGMAVGDGLPVLYSVHTHAFTKLTAWRPEMDSPYFTLFRRTLLRS
jgi:hypothetical protein